MSCASSHASPSPPTRWSGDLIQVVAETARLVLRELTDADLEAIQAYASDPAVVEFLPWGPNTEDDTRRFLSAVMAGRAARPRRQWGLADAVGRAPRLVRRRPRPLPRADAAGAAPRLGPARRVTG